ncbi:MAG TPA: DUF362 domain-containing protein [Phycisphaerae bacterium]|nr:DUF362 domain-containing protein [Phycisphaerae bacterium]
MVDRPGAEQPQRCPKTGQPLGCGRTRLGKRRWIRWVFPAVGLASLLWFLVRVIPKPSRVAYPCQRAAAPLASGFVLWLLGVFGSVLAWCGLRGRVRRAAPVATRLLFASAGLVALALALTNVPWPWAQAALWTPTDPVLTPVGTARGIFPGRVVWVHDPDATSWVSGTGRWWDDAYTDQTVVNAMVSNGLRRITGKSTDSAAWDAIFKHFNNAHGKGNVGYQSSEKIAIKLNLNTCGTHGTPGNDNIYNSPQVLKALLLQLINTVGVAGSKITVYDASRQVPAPIYNVCQPLGVSCVDSIGGDGRTAAVKDTGCPIYFSDPNMTDSGQFYPPTCVGNAAYVIDLPMLKGHDYAGVTLSAKNHFGSIWQPDGGWWPGQPIHKYIRAYSGSFWPEFPGRPMGTYNALVDLMGHKDLGGKTLLFLLDALYVAKSQSEVPNKWQSAPFNTDWTSSMFLSLDQVALDSVGVDFLRNETTCETFVHGTLDNYLHEAAQADNPPSGTFYDPDHDGNVARLPSLGVHEHWKDASSKKYTRDLGIGWGIELVSGDPGPVMGRYVFYNHSRFDGANPAADANDDGAIAPDKMALRPGGTASLLNYTSYSRGINGIMVDIAGLPGTPTASDFEFKVGNDNTPAGWAAAPAPSSVTVRTGAGAHGSDRVTILWADNAIQKQWLQVTVKANATTGLTTTDVFYFGNAIGETGNDPNSAAVTPADEVGARNNPHTLGKNPAAIDDPCDFNRDGKVGPTDAIIARNNGTSYGAGTALKLITVP